MLAGRAVTTLQTERLILRPWRDADLEPFAALNADPEVVRYLVAPMARDESDAVADRIRQAFFNDGWGLWAVQVRAGAPFVGFIGLNRPRFEAHFTPAVEVGWRLARAAWNHGYATEGARAALRFAFDELALPEVVAMTAVPNAPSRRVMEKLGMRRDPADDFDHPAVPVGHPMRRQVLYRCHAGQPDMAVSESRP